MIIGIARSTIQMTVSNMAGSIIIPNEVKKIATNASLNDSSLDWILADTLLSARIMPMKNAPMIGGTFISAATPAVRNTIPNAKSMNNSSLSILLKNATTLGTAHMATHTKNP